MSLPPLPEPAHRGPDGTGSYFDAFTADQMHAHAAAARLAALEEAAKLCESIATEWDLAGGYRRNIHEAVPQDGCDDCAAAIRSLAIHVPQTCTENREK